MITLKNFVRDLLEKHGPSTTSEIITLMVEGGVSESAARQRIKRAQHEYKKLAGLRLAKNARFLYLGEQYGDARYWDALERAFFTKGKSYWGAVIGLKAMGGRCRKSHFPRVCGAPLNRNGQLSPDRIYDRLSAINMLVEERSEESFIRFHPHHYQVQTSAETNAVLLAEFVALQAIKDWSRRIGFGSYGAFKIRDEDELPIVSSVVWDITAPSYIKPLVSARTGKLKPGFFVCDINLNGAVNIEQVELFLRKYAMASAPANISPILPFFVADNFTPSAFDRAKSAGVVAVTVSNLFGDDVAKALRDLIKLLTDTGATSSVNPDHLDRVMGQLTRIEGAANNLRGALFELAIGSLVKDVEEGYVRTGYEIQNYSTGRKAELDVLLDKSNEEISLVIECKAKIPSAQVSLEDVKKWYSDRVPLIVDTLLQDHHYQEKQLRLEIWTNGIFHNSALSWLESQNTEFETYSVGWLDGAGIKEYAEKANNKSIRKILDEHYFKNPLTKLSKHA